MAKNVSLLDYASQLVEFKKSGNTYYAICPFHEEKTASLAIKEGENWFKCFGCGKSGNIYKWIQWTENLTFDQAVQKVAGLTGSDIKRFKESDAMAFYKMIKKCHDSHKSEPVGRTILDINKDYLDKFDDEVPQEWVDEGISPEVMKKYEIRIDRGNSRIVYPVYDAEYHLIGVKGRTRFKNYKELGFPKYTNYYKIKTIDFFAGMKQAESYVKEKNQIIIVEGLKSVMKLDQWGFHNVVSAETSTLNECQVELLIKMQVHDVVIAFDKDVPWNKICSCTKFLRKFTNVWVVYDRWRLLGEKDSPPDRGEDVWRMLYERRFMV